MKKTLLIISDLHGVSPFNGLQQYVELFDAYFEIHLYDSLVLADLNHMGQTQKYIHNQFIATGIDRAAKQLVQNHKDSVYVLGFSIGGTIAWRAALLGLPVQHLFLISCTRIRFELQKPAGCIIDLHYGQEDPNSPSLSWFKQMELLPEFHPGTHDLYTSAEFAKRIQVKILQQIK